MSRDISALERLAQDMNRRKRNDLLLFSDVWMDLFRAAVIEVMNEHAVSEDEKLTERRANVRDFLDRFPSRSVHPTTGEPLHGRIYGIAGSDIKGTPPRTRKDPHFGEPHWLVVKDGELVCETCET